MMIKNKIISIPSIDDSGSDVSKRFDYQVACAFASVLFLSRNKKDFLILLDYLDDFVIIENEGKPDESITFCQVKTKKNKYITFNLIIKNEWMLKQAKNYNMFQDATSNIKNILITNFGFKAKNIIIQNTSLISINAIDNNEAKDKLITHLKTIIKNDDDLKNFYLLTSDLSLDEFESQLKGKLLDYILNSAYKNFSSISIKTVYQKLWSELRTKQTCVLQPLEKKNFNLIKDKKSFSYSRFNDILRTTALIQIPSKKDMANFCNRSRINFNKLTYVHFLSDYENFKNDLARNGTEILERCSHIIHDNIENIKKCKSEEECYSKIKSILDSCDIIKSMDFYKKYDVYISTILAYKILVE